MRERWLGRLKGTKLHKMGKEKIIVFDVETTGIDPINNEILQLCILDGSGSVLFNSLIKPSHRKRWPSAEKVNHISPSDVADKPTFNEIRDEVQSIFNKAKLVVGYNVNFDINFIEKAGISVYGRVFDVMAEYKEFRSIKNDDTHERARLIDCAEYFKTSYTPHSADSDCEATLYCFNCMIEDALFTNVYSKTNNNTSSGNSIKTSLVTRFLRLFTGWRTKKRKNTLFNGILLIFLETIALCYFYNINIISTMNEYNTSNNSFIVNMLSFYKKLYDLTVQQPFIENANLILIIVFLIGGILIVNGIIAFIKRIIRKFK